MVTIGILIGVISYVVFFLGIAGILHLLVVKTIALVVLVGSVLLCVKNSQVVRFIREVKSDLITSVLFILFLLQGIVNFIGVLGPELGFDALWYHLTLPKLYLLKRAVFHIPGGLLYYSDMPKLAEMIYTLGLSMGDERVVKGIHFIFGLLTCGVIYQLVRKYTASWFAMTSVLVFYTSLVVGWESTSGYIDLVRAFYEILAVSMFISWFEKKKEIYLYLSALCIGFAITTKLLALGTLGIFVLGTWFVLRKKLLSQRIKKCAFYIGIALLIPVPWFIFSYVHTGNPVFPFFSNLYPVATSINLLDPYTLVRDITTLFSFSDDPVSPMFLICIPLLIVRYNKFSLLFKLLTFFSLATLVVWYLTPRTGGGRFVLPYLPVWSVLVGYTINLFSTRNAYKYVLLTLVICFSVISVSYRGLANQKYLPFITGKETKAQFLEKHANFAFGDFYDIDGYFAKNIKDTDRILLIGFHNLFYVDFPFIHETWIKEGDRFNYIAIQNTSLPKRFSHFKKVYRNYKTNVSVYTDDRKYQVY